MKNSGQTIALVLLGAAIGVAVGVLVAPEKGSDTRKKLLAGAGDLAGSLGDQFSGPLDKLKALVGLQTADEKQFYENVHSESNPGNA